MIKKLHIENFKSIKNLQLDCKRINLFIGEPNAGKSNILESIALFALPYCHDVRALVRNSDLSNLFFENDVTKEILIEAGSLSCAIEYEPKSDMVRFTFTKDQKIEDIINLPITHHLLIDGLVTDFGIHPYFFKSVKKFDKKTFDFLSTPHGDNLFTLLQTNKNLRTLVSDFIQERGFKLTLRQATSEIEISKEVDNILTTYPYQVISDTLQRILFYISAIESNKSGTSLIFEEPESNVFPYYTKYLAEKISYSDDKQYFITTHNPYFLQSLIQKSPVEDLYVNIVYMDSYQTCVRPITNKDEIEELIDLDSNVFLNLDKFLPE